MTGLYEYGTLSLPVESRLFEVAPTNVHQLLTDAMDLPPNTTYIIQQHAHFIQGVVDFEHFYNYNSHHKEEMIVK